MSGGPHLGDFFTNRQEPGLAGLPVMSVTMNDSLVYRDDLDLRIESALRPEQHLLVKKGDIAYNMMRMWQGACGLAMADGIVSPAYVVLVPKPGIDSRFAYHWFKSDRMIYLFWAYSHGLMGSPKTVCGSTSMRSRRSLSPLLLLSSSGVSWSCLMLGTRPSPRLRRFAFPI